MRYNIIVKLYIQSEYCVTYAFKSLHSDISILELKSLSDILWEKKRWDEDITGGGGEKKHQSGFDLLELAKGSDLTLSNENG